MSPYEEIIALLYGLQQKVDDVRADVKEIKEKNDKLEERVSNIRTSLIVLGVVVAGSMSSPFKSLALHLL